MGQMQRNVLKKKEKWRLILFLYYQIQKYDWKSQKYLRLILCYWLLITMFKSSFEYIMIRNIYEKKGKEGKWKVVWLWGKVRRDWMVDERWLLWIQNKAESAMIVKNMKTYSWHWDIAMLRMFFDWLQLLGYEGECSFRRRTWTQPPPRSPSLLLDFFCLLSLIL